MPHRIARHARFAALPILCSLMLGSSAAAAENLRTFENGEFKFSFQYPASWGALTSADKTVTARIVSAPRTPTAECIVVVERNAGFLHFTQDTLDQIIVRTAGRYAEPGHPTEGLADGPGDLATVGALGPRPAQITRVRGKIATGTVALYVSGRRAFTATPGLAWTVTCSGQGATTLEAESSYLHWRDVTNRVMSSFRFK
jgi:hypothetical protein